MSQYVFQYSVNCTWMCTWSGLLAVVVVGRRPGWGFRLMRSQPQLRSCGHARTTVGGTRSTSTDSAPRFKLRDGCLELLFLSQAGLNKVWNQFRNASGTPSSGPPLSVYRANCVTSGTELMFKREGGREAHDCHMWINCFDFFQRRIDHTHLTSLLSQNHTKTTMKGLLKGINPKGLGKWERK